MRELRAPSARTERGVTTVVENTTGKRKGVGRPLPPPHHPSP
jgi:hypothetical protein